MINQRTIDSLQQLLHVPETTIRPWLSVRIGSSWIIDKHLPLSEVELSMSLKSIRKLITNKKRDLFASMMSNDNKQAACSSVFSSYADFNTLHQSYYETRKGLQNIYSFLSHDTIFDMGISNERFHILLPIILSTISPYELETMYAVNSMYRLCIAENIGRQARRKLYIRGSLLLFHARPFGIGYNANFLGMETSKKIDQSIYNQATGSDIDIRVKEERAMQYMTRQIQQSQMEYPDIIIEIAKQQRQSCDFIMNVSEAQKLIHSYLSSPIRFFIKPIPMQLKSFTEIRHAKQLYGTTQTLMNFTDEVRYKLYNSFHRILLTQGANDETIRILSTKFLELLSKAKMETDFYCRIKNNVLWETFKSVFQFSGYRFDTSELRNLFISLIKQATS